MDEHKKLEERIRKEMVALNEAESAANLAATKKKIIEPTGQPNAAVDGSNTHDVEMADE